MSPGKAYTEYAIVLAVAGICLSIGIPRVLRGEMESPLDWLLVIACGLGFAISIYVLIRQVLSR